MTTKDYIHAVGVLKLLRYLLPQRYHYDLDELSDRLVYDFYNHPDGFTKEGDHV